jgi:hypothetical protein
MKNKKNLTNNRFSKFSIIIMPEIDESLGFFDWEKMSKEEVVESLRLLKFKTPIEIIQIIKNLKPRASKRQGDQGYYYYGKSIDFGGQLELGSKKNKPHYQLWLEVKPKVRQKQLLEKLSQDIYQKEISYAISVSVLSEDILDYQSYCSKENRGDLVGEYGHLMIDNKMAELNKYMDENPELKNVHEYLFSYQKWLIQKLKENEKTRKILWIVDIEGNTGKSSFSDVLELDKRYNCLMLSLDHYRSFKYSSAKQILNFINENHRPPSALIIDAPRDEETKFLHESYGVLEELNNGRLFATFQGKSIKERMPRGIPIIVFCNCAPQLSSLSKDRWDVKALFRSVDKKDIYIQSAKVLTEIKSSSNNSVTWETGLEIFWEPTSDSEKVSDKMLFDMHSNNSIAIEKTKSSYNPGSDLPGLIKKFSVTRTFPTFKAPEYIQRLAQIHFELYKKD